MLRVYYVFHNDAICIFHSPPIATVVSDRRFGCHRKYTETLEDDVITSLLMWYINYSIS